MACWRRSARRSPQHMLLTRSDHSWWTRSPWPMKLRAPSLPRACGSTMDRDSETGFSRTWGPWLSVQECCYFLVPMGGQAAGPSAKTKAWAARKIWDMVVSWALHVACGTAGVGIERTKKTNNLFNFMKGPILTFTFHSCRVGGLPKLCCFTRGYQICLFWPRSWRKWSICDKHVSKG